MDCLRGYIARVPLGGMLLLKLEGGGGGLCVCFCFVSFCFTSVKFFPVLLQIITLTQLVCYLAMTPSNITSPSGCAISFTSFNCKRLNNPIKQSKIMTIFTILVPMYLFCKRPTSKSQTTLNWVANLGVQLSCHMNLFPLCIQVLSLILMVDLL